MPTEINSVQYTIMKTPMQNSTTLKIHYFQSVLDLYIALDLTEHIPTSELILPDHPFNGKTSINWVENETFSPGFYGGVYSGYV